MSVSEATPSKDDLRQEMRGALSCTSERTCTVAGGTIADRLCGSAEWVNAETVALFSSIRDEISTSELIHRAWLAGKSVLLPRVLDAAALEFAQVSSADQLVPGRYGISEPGNDCPVVELRAASLVVVPGLAFDRAGGRLGRGAGYYDRALERVRRGGKASCVIGLGFAFQVVSRVPMTPHDVVLDGVVTDVEWIRV